MARRSLLAPVLLLCFPAIVPAAEPFRYPEKAIAGKGDLKYVHPEVPVLTVGGTPAEIGEQVALLAARPGQRIFDYPRDFVKRWRTDFLWPSLVQEGEKMVKQFPADYRAEMEALVKVSGIEREKVVAGNTMFDIKKIFACSALVVEADRSATGGPLLGRNLDYPTLGYADQYSLVTVYRPGGKHAFASVGFPGLVGCLSGINDAGLCLGVLEIFSVKNAAEKYDGTGVPYALCHRRLLEECATVDEAEKLLRSMKRTTTICLAVCDRTGGAVFEVTAKNVIRRRPDNGFCPCTNHFLSEPLRPARFRNVDRTVERLQTLEQTCRALPAEGRMGPADLQKALHAVNLGSFTMQTMVFEPATLRLHLALGPCPASAHPLRTVDLAPFFRDSPTRK